MEQYVGLDVSLKDTWVCVVDQTGKIIWQGRCASTPEGISRTVQARAPGAVRLGLETGPLTTWLVHRLRAMGLPVVCLDARHAKAALKMQINKTDSNDAHGLAQIVRTGWYREVTVKGWEAHRLRALIGARAQVVSLQRTVANQVRGTLKTFGLLLGSAFGSRFPGRVRELVGDEAKLRPIIEALLAVWEAAHQQSEVLGRQIRAEARQLQECRLLMSIPGVGPINALTYVSTIEDPARFRHSADVGAYLGLTPKRYQSGEIDRAGRISKCGDGLLRTYLFEAANVLLTKIQRWSALKAWGIRLAKRVGFKKAKVAVARKLAVLMHRMLITGETFRWSEKEVTV
jgi:transposase